MQGIGVMLLFPLVDNRPFLLGLIGFGIVAPLLAMAGLYVVKKKKWFAALWMSLSFCALMAVYLVDPAFAPSAVMVGIVGLTWLSGLDYVLVGWKQLRGRGDFSRADGVRLIGGLALPILCFSVLHYTTAPRWTIFAIMAFELAVGGLDNLLSHEKVATKSLAWGGRVLGVSVMLGLALLLPDFATPFSIVAAAGSVGGVIAEFIRGKPYYVNALD
jgi:phosphatidylglycerophosphate synthase